MSSIKVENILLKGFHGLYDEERILGNYFLFTVVIQLHFSEVYESKNINDTINYLNIISIVQEENKKPQRLLETLLYNIRIRILALGIHENAVQIIIKKQNLLSNFQLKNVQVSC